jgi:hypothetical protein
MEEVADAGRFSFWKDRSGAVKIRCQLSLSVHRLGWSGSLALQRFAKPMQRYDYRRSVQRPAMLGDRLDHFPRGLIDRIVFLDVDVQAVRPNGFRRQLRRAITPIRGSESNGCSSLSWEQIVRPTQCAGRTFRLRLISHAHSPSDSNHPGTSDKSSGAAGPQLK